MVRVLPIGLLLSCSAPAIAQIQATQSYESIQEAPQEAFGTWDRYELLRRAREIFQRYDSPTWNRMYAWRVMNPNPFGPSISTFPALRTVTIEWEGASVTFSLDSGMAIAFHANDWLTNRDKDAARSADEVEAVAFQSWREFSGSSIEVVSTLHDRRDGTQGLSVYAILDGSPYRTNSSIGSATVSLRDLSVVSLTTQVTPLYRPGHDALPPFRAEAAVLAAVPRYNAWTDVSVEVREPRWERPIRSNGIVVSELDPGQDRCAGEGRLVLSRDCWVYDNSSYDPETGKFGRYVIATVDAVQGNVMSFFPAWKVIHQARGAAPGPQARPGRADAFEPGRAEALQAGGMSLPLEPGSLAQAGRTAPDPPFGRPLALLRGNRARYGVLCAEGLLWLPEGDRWKAWRLAPKARTWAGEHAPHQEPKFGIQGLERRADLGRVFGR